MRRNVIIALLVALALVAGACSGGDEQAEPRAEATTSQAGSSRTDAPPTTADGKQAPELGNLGALPFADCDDLVATIDAVAPVDGRNLVVAMETAAETTIEPYASALADLAGEGSVMLNSAAMVDAGTVRNCGFPFVQAALTKHFINSPGCFLNDARQPVVPQWCGQGEPVVNARPATLTGNPSSYCEASANLRQWVEAGVDDEAALGLVQAYSAEASPNIVVLLDDLFRELDEDDTVFDVWEAPDTLTALLAIDRATFAACQEAFADQLLQAVLGAESAIANPTTTTTSTTTTTTTPPANLLCDALGGAKPFDLDNVGRYAAAQAAAAGAGAPAALRNALTRLVQGNGLVADVLLLIEYDGANCGGTSIPNPPNGPGEPAAPNGTTTTAAPPTTLLAP